MPLKSNAADGEVRISGTITANTCDITTGTGGVHTVTLPTVMARTLSEAGKTAGRTPFTVELVNCSPDSGDVALYFEPGANTDMANGRLNNTGAATGVQVGLLNGSMVPIELNQSSASLQNSQTVSIASGSATLSYFAEYYATGAAGAGSVSTSTFFSIVYP
ncbi:type 1 fimbrial protein [Pseudomonas stutzeri]|uniref:fimbrial protein n=1 Tax=Stutzerimonas stutzeri TaxID=316 RepID=UPI00210AB2F7|nr:fimbrial protein [Stutzerimonas stutzeri]MCQ4286097.1 type 1 fimbrial protein [Stutzerimonas stutzeri]